MKKCNNCGAQTDDQALFCASCGSGNLSAIETLNGQPIAGNTNAAPAVVPPVPTAGAPSAPLGSKHGNIVAGIVGALLFSLVGGLLYFVIYQMDIIAGICGLVMFVLADFGYGLFAQTKSKTSLVRLFVAIIAMVIMIFAAEYLCLSYEIFQVYQEEFGITFFEAVKATPEFLAEPEIGDAVIEDLIFAYAFGFLATIGNITQVIKARKEEQ